MNSSILLMADFWKIAFVYCIASVFLSCQESIPPIENLNNGIIEPLGHGGMGVRSLRYPFNSYESIEASLNSGASGTELDVQLTADEKLVVFHDKNLEDHTNGEGRILDHTLSEILKLEYDFFSLGSFQITSLEPVLELFGKDKIIMLDCKFYPGEHDIEEYRLTFAKAIDTLARKYDIENTVFVEARDQTLLEEVGRLNPNLKLFYQPLDSVKAIEDAAQKGFFGLSLSMKRVSKEFVEKSQNAGLQVALYGSNTRSKNNQAIRMNPDLIQTDRLSHLIDILNPN